MSRIVTCCWDSDLAKLQLQSEEALRMGQSRPGVPPGWSGGGNVDGQ